MVLLFAILPVLRETEDAVSANGENFPGIAWYGWCLLSELRPLCRPVHRLRPLWRGAPDDGVQAICLTAGTDGLRGWNRDPDCRCGRMARIFPQRSARFFAGLAFSRDPEAVNIDAGFSGVYHSPCAFLLHRHRGLAVEVDAIGAALWIGLVLTLVAIAGKVLGAAIPSLLTTGSAGATLIGVSLVPRAEITMIIMERARQLGDWAVLQSCLPLSCWYQCSPASWRRSCSSSCFRRWPEDVRS